MQARYRLLGGYALLALLLDQLTKFWVLAAIPKHKSITVIPGLLDLVNIRNRGAAFGFLNRSDIEWQFWLFLLATLVAAVAIILLVRTAQEQPWLFRALGLVMGGALGNLIDRIRFRAVVDFLDIYVGDWHWPAFNVADMAICVGAGLACLLLWKSPQPGSKKEARP
ncbi:signal peptidase II [uncultured Desulfovibrio sp.]|uniref:signal peptidase II n=1 Tax=uncultured Desulfovibrio sp. TaxID=167968 RepID=UPI002629BBAF|nr:signal peptidase II [uncultured Desulfovibrio sp.]